MQPVSVKAQLRTRAFARVIGPYIATFGIVYAIRLPELSRDAHHLIRSGDQALSLRYGQRSQRTESGTPKACRSSRRALATRRHCRRWASVSIETPTHTAMTTRSATPATITSVRVIRPAPNLVCPSFLR
jgi:hypothetical protein